VLKDNGVKDLATIRNDVVGSLLRPERLKRAHQDYEDGKITKRSSGGVLANWLNSQSTVTNICCSESLAADKARTL
jgi:hypothetical protein